MRNYSGCLLFFVVVQAGAQSSQVVSMSADAILMKPDHRENSLILKLEHFIRYQQQAREYFNQTGIYPVYPEKLPEAKQYIKITSDPKQSVEFRFCTSEPIQNFSAESVAETPTGGYEYQHKLIPGSYELHTSLRATKAFCSSVVINGEAISLARLPLCKGQKPGAVSIDLVSGDLTQAMLPDERVIYEYSLLPGVIQCPTEKNSGGSRSTQGSGKSGGFFSCCFGGSPTSETEAGQFTSVGGGAPGGDDPNRGNGESSNEPRDGYVVTTVTFTAGSNSDNSQAQKSDNTNQPEGAVANPPPELNDGQKTLMVDLKQLLIMTQKKLQLALNLTNKPQTPFSSVQHLFSQTSATDWSTALDAMIHNDELLEVFCRTISMHVRSAIQSEVTYINRSGAIW